MQAVDYNRAVRSRGNFISHPQRTRIPGIGRSRFPSICLNSTSDGRGFRIFFPRFNNLFYLEGGSPSISYKCIHGCRIRRRIWHSYDVLQDIIYYYQYLFSRFDAITTVCCPHRRSKHNTIIAIKTVRNPRNNCKRPSPGIIVFTTVIILCT